VSAGVAMESARPLFYLLAGLPGSGKSTYARTLEATGVVRVSVDEEILARHGQIGIDYRVEDHDELLGPVVDWARERIVEVLSSGTSVVFDHGLGTQEQRDEFKRLANDCGANWQLNHFRVEIDELLRRLAARRTTDPNSSLKITPEILRYLSSVYEVPFQEGEFLIT
jgi:predicted kinase